MRMEQVLYGRFGAAALFLILAGCTQTVSPADTSFLGTAANPDDIVRFSTECEPWDDWNKPAKPFQVYGKTWYVGTCGIAAILITSDEGHVLIDSGTEEGAEVALANIRSLGFDPADIRVLLASHEHFDHVGGMAKMQTATGGEVIFSEIGIYVLANATDHPEDPQFGMHPPMQRITHGMPYDYGNTPELLASFGITPHPTPGHTPGAMSWSWQSCAPDRDCKTIVYADSMSPVSSDDYRFSDHPDYVQAYRDGIARIAKLDCDILLTPHPSHSKMIERAATATFEGGITCAQYAQSKSLGLDERLAKEQAQ